MKKQFLVVAFAVTSMILTFCGPSKKATSDTAVVAIPKLTYASNVSTTIMNNCVPCHVPSKGGNKKPYDNYANVKMDIDEILRRIQLNPTDKGFMPFKHAKLNDSTINIFKQWKADGMLEN
jgi:hypothetical protein